MSQRSLSAIAIAAVGLIAGGSFVGMTQAPSSGHQIEQPSLHDPAPPQPRTASDKQAKMTRMAEQMREAQMVADGLRDALKLEASRPQPQAKLELRAMDATAAVLALPPDGSMEVDPPEDAADALTASYVGSWVLVEYRVPGYQPLSTVTVQTKGSSVSTDGPEVATAYASGVLASVDGDKLVVSRGLVLGEDKATWTDVVSIPAEAVLLIQQIKTPARVTK